MWLDNGDSDFNARIDRQEKGDDDDDDDDEEDEEEGKAAENEGIIEEDDFLTSFFHACIVTDSLDTTTSASAYLGRSCLERPTTLSSPGYNGRKPKWWRNLSGRATKAQRRSQAALQELYQWPYPSKPRAANAAAAATINWNETYPFLVNSNNVNNSSSDNHSNVEVWLEIGFGQGDNLLRLAQQYPHVAFIGAEVHPRGVGKLYQRLERAQKSGSFWEDYTLYSTDADPWCCQGSKASNVSSKFEKSVDVMLESNETIQPVLPQNTQNVGTETLAPLYSNLRIYVGDGIKLLRSLPDQSLSNILITFPDPFPKNHEKEWRVVQVETLTEMHRVLRSNGRLYLATDHPKYAMWCQQITSMQQQSHLPSSSIHPEQVQPQHDGGNNSSKLWVPVEVTDRTTWLPVISPYERKGWQEGRRTHLHCWQATGNH